MRTHSTIEELTRPVATAYENEHGAAMARMTAKAIVEGVGTDAETVVNESGAKQSKTTRRCDLTPPLADLHVAEILGGGCEKYGEWNWLGIPAKDHINHALIHIRAFFAGDKTDDHIGHFACRAMMALEIHLLEEKGILHATRSRLDPNYRPGPVFPAAAGK